MPGGVGAGPGVSTRAGELDAHMSGLAETVIGPFVSTAREFQGATARGCGHRPATAARMPPWACRDGRARRHRGVAGPVRGSCWGCGRQRRCDAAAFGWVDRIGSNRPGRARSLRGTPGVVQSAAGDAGRQAHAADDGFRGVFQAQQVSMVSGVEGDEEGVGTPADLDRAEVEAYLLIAADAVPAGAPMAVGEQVGASGVGGAAWVAVVRGTGDADDEG